VLLVPSDGEVDSLGYLLNKSAPEDLVLRLFATNVTPAETDTTDDYVEATWTGYAAITLDPANWTITPGTPSQAAYPKQTFTSAADGQSGTNYGYYLTRVGSGRIAWAERFGNGPYLIVNAGDTTSVTARISQGTA